VNEPKFPEDPKEAIKLGFEKAEQEWTWKHAVKTIDEE
jgi:hypothetical protein